MGILDKIFGDYSEKELKKIEPLKKKVLDLEPKYEKMKDSELQEQTNVLKKRLADGETTDDILPDAFAVCREASWRVLGLRHFPVQILGGIVLHQGRIAEMRTGEGKTLVATLPAYLNALTEKGVHIVTVNDYLAKRDSEWMGRLYKFLGLSVGLVIHDIPPASRKESYAADITYGTNNEFGFDYLRDNMVTYKEQRVQRGHNYAIVDEVDSILIDEARTPLIISGPGESSSDLYKTADRFAKRLRAVQVAELDDKEDNDEIYSDVDYIVDQKAKTATLTPSGVAKAEKFFNLENLMDAENTTIQHHINQAIKANGVMHIDVDYVVKDGEVLIVDEFTGRLMFGRRYNEGLHQAIEAKEGVEVARESRTLATITFQNYFRLYNKLSGMTGTALTEEDEFREIYNLDCIAIPTNKPVLRNDRADLVYKTESAKFNAIADQVEECQENGQPILVGTVSIEKSEAISKILHKRKIKHQVLNAKFHDQEAAIVAQAGQYGTVTIATNMAGRGTDIILGGNAEYLARATMEKEGYDDEMINNAMSHAETDNEEILAARKRFSELEDEYKADIEPEAEKVRDAGGLFILGTERHESRRIDNQLRGRAGRQGDPGESQFFLSLEDDLLLRFNGDKVRQIMDTLKLEEDVPMENKMLTSVIESAQNKVEGRNFSIRKNVLKYDDVMNRQRVLIYDQRNMVLDDANLKEYIQKMIDSTIDQTVNLYLSDAEDPENWNMENLRDYYLGWLLTEDDLRYTDDERAGLKKEEVIKTIQDKAHAKYEAKEEKYSEEVMRELERVVLLRNVDQQWMDHIDAMDQLKQGMYLRSYGQHDPVDEYRREGTEMFDGMIDSIREDTIKLLMTVEVKTNDEPKREQVMNPGGLPNAKAADTSKKKVGRNDPCPCGSGKKYKYCHGK